MVTKKGYLIKTGEHFSEGAKHAIDGNDAVTLYTKAFVAFNRAGDATKAEEALHAIYQITQSDRAGHLQNKTLIGVVGAYESSGKASDDGASIAVFAAEMSHKKADDATAIKMYTLAKNTYTALGDKGSETEMRKAIASHQKSSRGVSTRRRLESVGSK